MRDPALWPAVALLTGVVLGWRAPWAAGDVLLTAFVLAWCATLVALVAKQARLFVGAALGGFLLAGVQLAAAATTSATETGLWRWYQQSAAHTPDRPVILEGRLARDAAPTDYGATLDLRVSRVMTPTGWIRASGGARVAVGGALTGYRRSDWIAGRTVRLTSTLKPAPRYLNPGLPDQQRSLMLRGTALLGSVKSALLVDVVRAGGTWAELAGRFRSTVRRDVGRTVGRFSERSAGVVTAVLIGDRAGLSPDDRRRLQAGGTYHVIAISGGNVAILAAAILLALRLVRVPFRLSVLIAVGLLLGYGAAVGPEASVARATFAAVIVLTALASDHRAGPLNTVALVGGCLVAVAPLSIIDPGFLLTFGATLGILVGVGRLLRVARSFLQRFGRRTTRVVLPALALLAATVCAELALLPIAAGAFSRLTAAGLLLNFLAIPLMTAAQIGGLVAVAALWLSEPLAHAVGYATHLAAAGIVDSARLIELAPWLTRRVPPPGIATAAGYYLGWIVWLARPPGVRRVWALLGIVVCGMSMVVGPARPMVDDGPCGEFASTLSVHVLDVGQADATFVRLPTRKTLLVDSGGQPGGRLDVGGRIIAPILWHFGVRRLDYLAISHGDPDHIGGAASVTEDFRPREVWEGVPVPGLAVLDRLAQLSADRGASWRQLQKGDTLRSGDVRIHVWHPPLPDWERPRVRNDDSLVLEIRYRDVSIVLPGDIGAEVETRLAREIQPAGYRILKVPHHGSRTSSSTDFLEALRPDIAVVSAGRYNRFGHPAAEVLGRYAGLGVEVVSTAEAGAVSVCTDGSAVAIKTMGPRS